MKKKYRILICCGACLAALALPALGLEIMLPPVIALAGFMGAEWGLSYLMPVLLCGSVSFCVLQPWASSGNLFMRTPSEYCLVVTFVLVTVAAALCMRRRVKNRWALLCYTAILCVGLYLSFTAGSILAGKPPYTGAVDYLKALDREFDAVLGDAYSADSRARVALVIESTPDLLMMLSLLLAEIMGFTVFIMGRVFYRAFRKEPTKMADITMWRLPSSALWGLLLTAAVCAAAFILKLNIAASLAWTMGLVFVSMFAVQGFSFISFLFARAHSSKGIKAFGIIFLVLFMPYTALFLALVGIYEQIGKKRLLFAAYERQMKLERSLRKRHEDYEKYGYTAEDILAAAKKHENDKAGEGEKGEKPGGGADDTGDEK